MELIVNFITLLIFFIAWLSGVLSWFYGFYQMIRMQWDWLRSKPSKGELLDNLFWRKGLVPTLKQFGVNGNERRRKMYKGFLVFICSVLIGMLSGLVGNYLGDWKDVGNQSRQTQTIKSRS